MTPVLIYSNEEAKRNKFAVEIFCKELGAVLHTPDYRGKADFVINRSNDYKIAQYYENQGVRVFNPSDFSMLANNKQLCYDYMENNGIKIMPTRYKEVPFVKKTVDGHGGTGVKMCYSVKEYDENFVCQKPSSDLGKDLRVWVLKDRIIASVLRESKVDFRSNYCLGGSATVYNLSDSEEKLVNEIISLVKGDYYGIDFVFDNSKIVFNELEDTVGARMLYDKTDIDILKMYCDYIKNEMY